MTFIPEISEQIKARRIAEEERKSEQRLKREIAAARKAAYGGYERCHQLAAVLKEALRGEDDK